MSHRSRGIVRNVAAAMLASTVLNAQEGDNTVASSPVSIGDVPHTTQAIMIDGVLDDALWRDALVIELDFETWPRENVPPPVETFVYLIEDGSQLLIAFDARDPHPEEIRAYLRDRDSAYNDDFVGVVLDTFNDQRRAFEFFVNPLGVQMDMTMDDVNGGEDDSWDAIWESGGEITDRGFTVEMAIPFSQLRFQRTDGPQTWGIDTLRFYPRTTRVRMSAHAQDRGRNCYLCQMDKVRGFENAEPGRGLEVVPSLTASRTDERDDALDALVDGDTDSEVGVNVRWAVTPDMIANLALNPDFSQVEADVPQLDVNNQFALFFPETRPFFLEGANFFNTPINAVFTRTVADPDLGAKFTGTSDTNTFGLFAAEDAVTNLLFPAAQRSTSDTLEQSNEVFVGRYQRGFGNNSAIGALVTTRSGNSYHNHVLGLDGNYRPNDRHSLRFQYLGSDTEYPAAVVTEWQQPAGSFTGDALHLNYNYGTREWEAFANYRRFDRGFRVDSGFVSQVDFENRNVGFNRTWYAVNRWWNQMTAGANTGSSHDMSGQLLNRWRELFYSIEGPWQLFAQAGLVKQQQFWNGVLYDLDRMWSYSQMRPRGGLNMGLEFNLGDQIDFTNSQLGDQVRFEPWMNFNAGRHLLIGLQFTSERLDTQTGELIFDAELLDMRMTWQFNLRSFLRLTMQQQQVERNLAQYVDPSSTDAYTESRGAQLLYSYQLNPQTVVYAGYSDNHIDDDDLDSLTKTDRTLFLKVSYAWIPG